MNITLDPLSLRPEPNRRYETVTEAELVEIGASIITAKRQIAVLESNPRYGDNSTLLTEWRRTLRMLQAAKKAARRTSQLRLF